MSATRDAGADLTRPIIGIENRTAHEVFDIMCGRIQAAAALRLSAGGGKIEHRKFYHHGYSIAELLKARKSPPEFFTDDGEAWRYEYTHADGEGGAYDMLYRPASPTVEAGRG